MRLALEYPNVLVARTFSKGYSLCFLRVGYMVGHPSLIAAFHKIRDSYNVNGVAQIAAMATLDEMAYYRKNFKRVIATRARIMAQLAKLGFEVRPSQTNFVLEYELLKWLRIRTNVLQGASTQAQLFQRMQGSGADLLVFFSY